MLSRRVLAWLLAGVPFCLAAEAQSDDAASAPRVTLTPSFALGTQTAPATQSSLGELAKPAPEDPTHPLPRVIVDVVASKGGVSAARLQAAARRLFWGKAVACYTKSAWAEPGLRVDDALDVSLEKGRLKPVAPGPSGKKRRAAKSTAAPPASRSAATQAIEACLARELSGLDLGLSGKRTRARLRVRISAGDEPIPPPDAARERGPGTIDGARVDTALAALTPQLRSCYVAALEYAPELRGSLALRLRIEPDGRISEAFEHGAPFADPRAARCMLRALRGATLPAPEGGFVRVLVGLDLNTGDARP